MKRKLGIITVVIALILGAVGIGWAYFRLNPAAWDDFVAEMRGETANSAALRPVKRPARKAGGLFASGTIEAEEVTVAAEMGGRIVALLADEGDELAAGDVLVRLDQTILLAQREQAEAAVAQAQAALDAARAQLALAEVGARDEEIAMAEGMVDSAQAGLEAARGQQAAAEAELKVTRAQLTTANVAQTNAELLVTAAQADLDAAEAQLSAAEVAQTNAELLVTAAQADLDRAEAQLAQVQAGATEDDIAIAESAVEGAQAQLEQWQAGPDEETVQIAKLNWDLARNALWQAQLERDATKGTPGVPGYQKDLVDAVVGAAEIGARIAELQYQLAAKGATNEQIRVAQAAVSQAQAQLDKVKAGARSEETAMAQAGVDAAQAQLAQAEAGIVAAKANVDTAQAGVDAAQVQLAQAEAGVDAAKANVDTARAGVEAAQAAAIIAQAGTDAALAQLDQAQASLDLLKAGAQREQISLLEANVAQAEAALAGVEAALKVLDAQLGRMTLAASVGGIVVERLVHVGELASPGGSLLTLANLDEVTLTVYVPEADLGQVWLGQTVEVTVDAYGDVFTGQVSHIASQAEFTPKNVQTQEERVHMVFAVKIQLDNADHRLKPGMPADATFQ
jgi:multidrug resistance efflux pump